MRPPPPAFPIANIWGTRSFRLCPSLHVLGGGTPANRPRPHNVLAPIHSLPSHPTPRRPSLEPGLAPRSAITMVLRGRNPSRRPSVAAAPVGLGQEALTAKETPAPAATASPKAPQPPKQPAAAKAAPAAKAGKKTGPAEAAGSSAGVGSGGACSSGSGKKTQTPEFLVKLHRILQNEDRDIILWDNGACVGCLVATAARP